MAEREVYPHAPLRLVALELRFPIMSSILTRKFWEALETELADLLPHVDVLTKDPDELVPTSTYEPVIRRISEDKQRAVTIYQGALTVEVANYRHLEDLRGLAKLVLRATDALPRKLICTRMGLRFINEIDSRILFEDDLAWVNVDSWSPYVNKELLRQVKDQPKELHVYAYRGRIWMHAREGEQHVTLDYSVQPESIVEPEGVLLLKDTLGPCFVLDIDAVQFGTADAPVAKDAAGLLDELTGLHRAVESVFQWSVTDTAREVFRGRERGTSSAPAVKSASA